MKQRIKIKELSDRQLLEFHLTNQIVIIQKLERIYNHLKEKDPESKALIEWRNYHEIYDDLFSRMDDVWTQVEYEK
jgi:hypothetical protein